MSENKIRAKPSAIAIPYGRGYIVEVYLGEDKINILARNGLSDLTKQEAEEICNRINHDPEQTRKEERDRLLAKVEDKKMSLNLALLNEQWNDGYLTALNELKSFLEGKQ